MNSILQSQEPEPVLKFAWSRKIKKRSAPATLLSSPQQATRQAAEPEPKHFLVRSEPEPDLWLRLVEPEPEPLVFGVLEPEPPNVTAPQ